MRIFAGKHRGRKLAEAPTEGVRPTTGRVREALFHILGPSVEGMRVLDLFAGTGAVGLEALSQGAASVTFVEQTSTSTIKKNLEILGEEGRVLQMDVFEALVRLADERFDLIFADPPYHDREIHQQLLERAPPLLADGGRLFIEAPAKLRIEGVKKRKYGRSTLLELE